MKGFRQRVVSPQTPHAYTSLLLVHPYRLPLMRTEANMLSMNSSQEPKRVTRHPRRKTQPLAPHRPRQAPRTRPPTPISPLRHRHRQRSPTREARSSLPQTARLPAPARCSQDRQAHLAPSVVHRNLADSRAWQAQVMPALLALPVQRRPLGWGSLWHQAS